MQPSPDLARAYTQALAELYERTAQWRRQKASRFPDDLRNHRAARALSEAAQHLDAMQRPLDCPPVRLFAEFDQLLAQSRGPIRPEKVIADDGAAGRFFFDEGSRRPTDRDFDSLVATTLRSTLESWRDRIEADESPLPEELVLFFDHHDTPLWELETDEEWSLAADGLTDEELLEFDYERLAHFDVDAATQGLAAYGDVYRSQLATAKWIQGWADRLEESPAMPGLDEEYHRGWIQALREVAANLRQGDLLPGGVLYDETVSPVDQDRDGS